MGTIYKGRFKDKNGNTREGKTFVRNLIRSGVTENISMKITGHKTQSVFYRYNIVTPDDLKLAAEKQAEKLACDNFCDKRALNSN